MTYQDRGGVAAQEFDPFAMPPEELFGALHLSVELMRDGCMGNQEIMADPRRGAGRCYVLGASLRLRDLLEVDGWKPLPAHEAFGLPDGLLYIEDPVWLPPNAPLMLAHFVAKHYVDDLRAMFGRADGVFFPRAVTRLRDTWVTGRDVGATVDEIIEDQYLWLGGRTPLVVADWLLNRTRHEVSRLNPRRVAVGRPELVAPCVATIRRRLRRLNEKHGWPGGRNPAFVDDAPDFLIP